MEALTQAQLPPLGTAMYDGVWEWVYELVIQAEKAKLMMGAGTSHVDKPQRDTQPTNSLEMATEVPQEAMDTSEQDKGNQGYLMELPNLERMLDNTPALPLSEQPGTENQLPREGPQEAPLQGESQVLQRKTSSSSGRSSESDSPLMHSNVRSQLLHQCLYGVAVCAVRCPTYFKPLYRVSSALLKLGLPKVH